MEFIVCANFCRIFIYTSAIKDEQVNVFLNNQGQVMITHRCDRGKTISDVPSNESHSSNDFSEENRRVTEAFNGMYSTTLLGNEAKKLNATYHRTDHILNQFVRAAQKDTTEMPRKVSVSLRALKNHISQQNIGAIETDFGGKPIKKLSYSADLL